MEFFVKVRNLILELNEKSHIALIKNKLANLLNIIKNDISSFIGEVHNDRDLAQMPIFNNFDYDVFLNVFWDLNNESLFEFKNIIFFRQNHTYSKARDEEKDFWFKLKNDIEHSLNQDKNKNLRKHLYSKIIEDINHFA